MSDFFLTLPSNSSMKQFPNNNASHYFTKLPQNIDLSGKTFEVALVEAQIPNSYTNVSEELISSVNKLIHETYTPSDETEVKTKFFYDRSSKRATLALYTEGSFVELSPTLQRNTFKFGHRGDTVICPRKDSRNTPFTTQAFGVKKQTCGHRIKQIRRFTMRITSNK